MSTPPSPPSGYAEATSEELSYPGVEIGMLAVFTGIGWVLQQQQPVDALGSVQFIVLALVVVFITELLHEGCHVLAFSSMGIESSVVWKAFSVIPMDRFVSRSELMRATLAPLVLLTSLFGVVYVLASSPVITILAGFGIAVNSALSVLDIAVFLRQVRTPKRTLYSFDTESGELDAVWVFEPANS